ncbi:hypothetical protein, partial [Brevifollis gellanilyticus]|uniref:hypothetical protein n=1 Tax=Brevifollis gellanilyticus TaxID=748831 RepID=UPI001C3F97D4
QAAPEDSGGGAEAVAKGRKERVLILRPLYATLLTLTAFGFAADAPPAKPVLKITPGKVIVPFDKMQRPWGELISLDPVTRTGKFRRESTDEIVSFTVMPYAELLHHATYGDLQDFRVGERAIFRLHENEKGEWVWLTYIQDQMNMMNGHKEYFYVDSIDPSKGVLTCTQANFDKSFIREKGILISTDAETRYWKDGQPAKFSDVHVGDKIRTKTHGIGKGKVQMCWEVFLDDASLQKFQAEQKAVHEERMRQDGAPGYIDEAKDGKVTLTLFQEGEIVIKQLKAGGKAFIAPAGVDRKATAEVIEAKVNAVKMTGKLCQVILNTSASISGFKPTGLVRLWAHYPSHSVISTK